MLQPAFHSLEVAVNSEQLNLATEEAWLATIAKVNLDQITQLMEIANFLAFVSNVQARILALQKAITSRPLLR